MAATSTTIVTPPDPDDCPSGNLFYNAIKWVADHITTTTTLDAGTGIQIVRQSATPAPTPNTVWHRIDDTGGVNAPLGEYVYMNGRFVRQPFHEIGTILMIAYSSSGLIDSTGKGLFAPVSPATDTPNIAGPLFGWALANGQNGTYNIHNRFMLAADSYSTDVNHWVSSVKQADGTFALVPNGGRDAITLTPDMLGNAYAADYDSTGSNATPRFYAGGKYTATAGLVNLGINTQIALPTILPLFCSVGVFQNIGYYAASQS